MKYFLLHLSDDLHREVKVRSAFLGITMQEYFGRIVADGISHNILEDAALQDGADEISSIMEDGS